MCKRSETRAAQSVQDEAAEALAAACKDCSDQLGTSLRAVYEEALKEGVPRPFQELLERLR